MNKVIFLRILSFSVLLFIISGCSATYYKLKSTDSSIDFYKGREVAHREDEKYSTSISFEDQEDGNFIFYITVQNFSESLIIFYPENIYADQLHENMEQINNPVKNCFFAIDPGKRLDYLESELESRKKQHDVTSGLNFFLAAVNVAADLSDDHSRHKAKKVGDDIAIWADNQTNENVNYEIDKNDINSQKNFWENQVLRKTTLYQNDNTGGLIFIPFNENAKFIRLIIPVGEKKHIYLFRKIEIHK
jgi:hypothetical protein